MNNFELAYPITPAAGGEPIKTVTVRRARAKDLAAADTARRKGGDMGAAIQLMASLSDISFADIENMDAEDFTKISEALADFLPKRPV